jgi:hypothetical protein
MLIKVVVGNSMIRVRQTLAVLSVAVAIGWAGAAMAGPLAGLAKLLAPKRMTRTLHFSRPQAPTNFAGTSARAAASGTRVRQANRAVPAGRDTGRPFIGIYSSSTFSATTMTWLPFRYTR